jgi:hypothetical protein
MFFIIHNMTTKLELDGIEVVRSRIEMEKILNLFSASILDSYKHIECVTLEYRCGANKAVSIRFYDGNTNRSITIYDFLNYSEREINYCVSLIKNRYLRLLDVTDFSQKNY